MAKKPSIKARSSADTNQLISVDFKLYQFILVYSVFQAIPAYT